MNSPREEGAGGIFIFALLLLTMVVLLAMLTLSRTTSAVDERAQTKANLATAAAALEQFAGSSGRLPCPADPTKDDGLSSPNNATANCLFPQGTVPWATIGMRRDDAFDAWGWKIGYRVYDGNKGMTQANGASMVNCDTVQALNQVTVDATGLCQAVGLPPQHDTPDFAFPVGKGLPVNDFGTTYDGTKPTGGAAYVLISFGPSGFGAYTAAGAQNANQPKSSDEKNNLKATGPFVLEPASVPSVSPDDNTHYDDILVYRTITDLAKKANLAARDWQDDDVTSSNAFDRTTVSNAMGGGADPGSNGGNTGRTTLSFPFTTVTGFDSTGDQAISFTSATGGATDSIGVASPTGGGGNDLSSTGGEGLRFDFAGSSRQFSISLANFTRGFFFGIGSDQVQVTFLSVNGATATTIGNAVPKTACGFASTSSFTIDLAATGIADPKATFNRVEIRPLPRTVLNDPSSFRVEEVRTCIAGVPCQTTLYGSGDKC
jgi:hypothetical protein